MHSLVCFAVFLKRLPVLTRLQRPLTSTRQLLSCLEAARIGEAGSRGLLDLLHRDNLHTLLRRNCCSILLGSPPSASSSGSSASGSSGSRERIPVTCDAAEAQAAAHAAAAAAAAGMEDYEGVAYYARYEGSDDGTGRFPVAADTAFREALESGTSRPLSLSVCVCVCVCVFAFN